MQIIKSDMQGILEIIPEVFQDNRGNFFENYNEEKLKDLGIPRLFPLEFQSTSKKGVLRGFHYQKNPYAQGKLVRVISGIALDVVIDIRKNSPTFGKWISFILSEEKNNMLWIPIGFAHGFLSLKENTIMQYKLTSDYKKESESGIIWNDSSLNVDWQLSKYNLSIPILSDKDKKHPLFKDAFHFQ